MKNEQIRHLIGNPVSALETNILNLRTCLCRVAAVTVLSTSDVALLDEMQQSLEQIKAVLHDLPDAETVSMHPSANGPFSFWVQYYYTRGLPGGIRITGYGAGEIAGQHNPPTAQDMQEMAKLLKKEFGFSEVVVQGFNLLANDELKSEAK